MKFGTTIAAAAVCAALSVGALAGCSSSSSQGSADSTAASTQTAASESVATSATEKALPSFGKKNSDAVSITAKNGTGATITQITVTTKGAKKQTFLAKKDKIKKNQEFMLNVAAKHVKQGATSTITITLKNGESYDIAKVPLSKVKGNLTFKMKGDLAFCMYQNASGKTISLYQTEKKLAEKEAAEKKAIMTTQTQGAASQETATTADTADASNTQASSAANNATANTATATQAQAQTQTTTKASPASAVSKTGSASSTHGSAKQQAKGCLDDPANQE